MAQVQIHWHAAGDLLERPQSMGIPMGITPHLRDYTAMHDSSRTQSCWSAVSADQLHLGDLSQCESPNEEYGRVLTSVNTSTKGRRSPDKTDRTSANLGDLRAGRPSSWLGGSSEGGAAELRRSAALASGC